MTKGMRSKKLVDPTLGPFMKGLREKVHLSISEITDLVYPGSKNVHAIRQFEEGKTTMGRDKLERFLNACDATFEERNLALGLAGYIHLVLPSAHNVELVLDEYSNYIERYPYPAYIIDCNWRIFCANSSTSILSNADMFRTTGETVRRDPHLNLFDFMFNRKFGFVPYEEADLPESVMFEFYFNQILRFKSDNIYRQHFHFYRSYPECMRDRLGEYYDLFEKAWNYDDSSKGSKLPFLSENPVSIEDFDMPQVHYKLSTGNIAYFDLISQFVAPLGDWFSLIRYQPLLDHGLRRNQLLKGDEISRNNKLLKRVFVEQRVDTSDIKPFRLWNTMTANTFEKYWEYIFSIPQG